MHFRKMHFRKMHFRKMHFRKMHFADHAKDLAHLPWTLGSARREASASGRGGFFENAFFENFANFWRARSRLYQNEILQENMRSAAFFKLYKICILVHRCNLKILAKNLCTRSAFFVKIKNSANFSKCCKCLPNFKNVS